MRIRCLRQAAALSVALTTAVCWAAGEAREGPSHRSASTSAANLARVGQVMVSSELEGLGKDRAIDGDRATEWAAIGAHPRITLQWETPVGVGRIVLRDRAGAVNRAQGGKLLFSDGIALDVEDIPAGGAPCEIRFSPRRVRWMRLDLFSAIGPNPGLAEIEVYGDSGPLPTPALPRHPAAGTLVTIRGNDERVMTVDKVREGQWCAAMWCGFAGTDVKLFGNTGPGCGLADVFVDGIWQKTVDWYSETPVNEALLFSAGNLADGKHLLGVLTRGTKHPQSKGTAIHWSRIEYTAGAHPERFVPVKRTQFNPNVPQWLDDRGEMIQGHLGGVMYHDGMYYMVGQDWRGKRIPGFNFDWCKNMGMPIYSSPDLMNWTYRGIFSQPSSNPEHPLYNYALAAGRGKILRARSTGRFVSLFMIVDHTFKEFNTIAAAVADRPEGPYAWHGIMQVDDRRMQGADTAVFTDDDGKQYLITGKHAPDWNVADCLYELSPDCLSVVKARVLATGGEAPAIFKHEGIYYLLHSQLTGLQPNDNFYHIATNIWGPWQAKGTIARGDHAANTFQTQTMDVVPIANKPGAFIWIGDSLRNNANPYTRTVWLPLTIVRPGELEVRWRDAWDVSVFK